LRRQAVEGIDLLGIEAQRPKSAVEPVFPEIDSGFLGTSPEVLQDTYGHHRPDYLQEEAAAIGQKGRYVSVAETVVNLTEDRNQTKNPNDFWSEWQDSNLRPLRPERSALPG